MERNSHPPRSSDVTPKGRAPQAGSPYEHASAPHLSEPSARVTPRATSTGSSPYEFGHTGPEKTESAAAVTPKSTSGDKDRPAMVEVERARAPITKARPKHQSVRKALA